MQMNPSPALADIPPELLVRTDFEYAYRGAFVDTLVGHAPPQAWLDMCRADLANQIRRVRRHIFCPGNPHYLGVSILFGGKKSAPTVTSIRRMLQLLSGLPDAYWVRRNELREYQKRRAELEVIEALLPDDDEPDEPWI